MNVTDEQLRNAVDAVFAKYDTDNSQSLDSTEVFNLITDALAHMKSSRQITQAEVQQFINAVDSSGDNKIQKPELLEIFKKVLNSQWSAHLRYINHSLQLKPTIILKPEWSLCKQAKSIICLIIKGLSNDA